jgi:hypothetical protein
VGVSRNRNVGVGFLGHGDVWEVYGVARNLKAMTRTPLGTLSNRPSFLQREQKEC